MNSLRRLWILGRGFRGKAACLLGSRVTRLQRTVASPRRTPLVVFSPLLVAYLLVPLELGAGSNQADEPNYLGFAHRLLNGHFVADHGFSRLQHGPGLPLLLAPFVALHVPVLVLRCLFGPVLLFVAVLVFFRLAAQYLNHRAALVAALVFGAYWPFATLLRTIHSQPLTLLIVVLLAYETSRWSFHRRTRDLVLAGVLVGWLALTRLEFGYLVALWLVLGGGWYLMRRSQGARYVFAVSALGLALCVPYLAYTYSVFHRPFYWSDTGGGEIYWMASGRSGDLGDAFLPHDVFTNPHLAPHRAFFRHLEGLPPAKRDRALTSAAVHNIEHHPWLYLRNVVFNAGRLVVNSPYSYTPTKWTSIMFYGVPAGLLLIVVSLGLATVARRRLPIPFEMKLFALFSIMTFLEHAVVAGYARLFVYIVPTLMLFGAYTAAATRWPTLAVGARAGDFAVEKAQRRIGLTAYPSRLYPAVGSETEGLPGRAGLGLFRNRSFD